MDSRFLEILFQGKVDSFDEMIFKGKAAAAIVNGKFVMKNGEVL